MKTRTVPVFSVFKKSKALVMFFVGGVPDLKSSAEILEKLPGLGCDIVKIGVPFSDPLADGSVIRSAYQEGLEKGVMLAKILNMIKNSGKMFLDLPICLKFSATPIFFKNFSSFVKKCKNNVIS